MTSLFREHTDWHGSEEAYRADKLRLLGLPGVRVAVVDWRDERLREELTRTAPATGVARVVPMEVRYGTRGSPWMESCVRVPLSCRCLVRTTR